MENNENMPPVIIPGYNSLVVDDTEPLDGPPDPNWVNPIHIECQMPMIDTATGRRKFIISGTSASSNAVTISYIPHENTIVAEINDVGLNNGGSFSGEFEYDPTNERLVYADVKKGGGKVGKVKHTINYGTE